ncbi:hypothetical protein FSP39_018486 [Pinctada imbricata]|uniref:Glutathione peroxidase n=1 Tax=Pinctada imbricata TaxID=66713 RepID=A0AA88YSU9_PINIB|nr:hypothetical protein FSP39_018486 [Pinctada imbricata]
MDGDFITEYTGHEDSVFTPVDVCSDDNGQVFITDYSNSRVHILNKDGDFKCYLEEEPGWNGTEILDGIKYVRPGHGFVPAFPLTEKVDVNGENEHPLYTYLKYFCPYIDDVWRSGLYYSPIAINDVHWNFDKFLVGRDGRIVKRFHAKHLPEDMKSHILTELSKADPFTTQEKKSTSNSDLRDTLPQKKGGDLQQDPVAAELQQDPVAASTAKHQNTRCKNTKDECSMRRKRDTRHVNIKDKRLHINRRDQWATRADFGRPFVTQVANGVVSLDYVRTTLSLLQLSRGLEECTIVVLNNLLTVR